MNRSIDPAFDQRIADWLEEDPIIAPRELVSTVLAAAPSIPQRRAWGVSWRYAPMSTSRLAAMAAVLVVALGVVFVLKPLGASSPPAPSAMPSPSPAASSSPSTPATTAPLPSPTDRISGATPMTVGAPLAAGVVYAPAQFSPSFILKGLTPWLLEYEHPDALQFAPGSGASAYDKIPEIQILVPAGVMAAQSFQGPATATPNPAPADLIGYLRSRTDLTIGPSKSVTVGGITGTEVDGSLRTYPGFDKFQYENLFCAASSPGCSVIYYTIGIGLDRPFRMIFLEVHGQQVVINLNTAGPAADFSPFDTFLKNLTWQ